MIIDKKMIFNYIEMLINEYNFNIFLSKRNQLSFIRWKRFLKNNNMSEIEVHFGSTKAVIIKDNLAIKIPFNAGRNWRFNNYCEEECKNYLIAKEYNLDKFFAEVEFLGRFYYKKNNKRINFPVYVMEKAEVDNEKISSVHGDLLNRLYENSQKYYRDCDYDGEDLDFYDSLNDDEINIVEIFSSYYDDNDVYDLISFIRSEGINDIHYENIGFIESRPFIIDYSGY